MPLSGKEMSFTQVHFVLLSPHPLPSFMKSTDLYLKVSTSSRSAFLSKGHTIHLFIQNNQAWLEKNQEKFGKKQVKFGYVVYTEPEVARRLLSQGHVLVGHARVAVKEMDGQPALFNN